MPSPLVRNPVFRLGGLKEALHKCSGPHYGDVDGMRPILQAVIEASKSSKVAEGDKYYFRRGRMVPEEEADRREDCV